MSTAPQILANQQNAALSTGPRTADGKAASARNAVKHNLNGRFTLLQSEDKEVYAQHVLSFIIDLQPVGALEESLVETVADLHWRLNRIRAREEKILTQCGEGVLDQAGANEMAALAMLGRYEAQQHRVLAKTLSELRITQKTRKADEQQAIIEAFERQNKVPYHPQRHSHFLRSVRIGFVLEKSPAYLRCQQLLAEEFAATCEQEMPDTAEFVQQAA